MIDFTIPMRPVPKARARVTKRGFTYTPKRTADAEKVVANYARQYIKAPLEGPVAMVLEFVYAVSASWPKKKKEDALSGRLCMITHPDLDNICKLIIDALNGIGYNDDQQIIQIKASKKYGECNQIFIAIEEIAKE